ncbi:MAG: hypothetical protein CR988_06235 [Treponema sp.]|nr:MAG: hypothetical protein CR988_06235 [Treponema sp.]
MTFMTIIIPLSIVIGVITFFVIILPLMQKVKKNSLKDRNAILNAASKKLAQNPHDFTGLSMMGGVYFEDNDWEKAYSVYSTLSEQVAGVSPMKQLEINIRYGISALKTARLDEARKGFVLAKTIEPHNFKANYNLGYVSYLQKDYERAVSLLRQALSLNRNDFNAIKYLGYAYQKLRKHNEALPYLKQAFDVKPDDKDILFSMGESFFELGISDKALKILSHLRADPIRGPQAALYCGLIRAKLGQPEKAIEDLEIGLKHENIPVEIEHELRYRLAKICLGVQNIGRALTLLKEIQAVNQNYKDVATLILKYQEINQSKNLKTYLISGQSEFVGLCRRIVTRFYPKAKVKIVDITVLTTHTDVVAEIDTLRFTDTVVFRFFRSQGAVGELLLRDFHGRIKELKTGSGVCMTAGDFTQEAINFSEGRPIELYNKARLNNVLNSLG